MRNTLAVMLVVLAFYPFPKRPIFTMPHCAKRRGAPLPQLHDCWCTHGGYRLCGWSGI